MDIAQTHEMGKTSSLLFSLLNLLDKYARGKSLHTSTAIMSLLRHDAFAQADATHTLPLLFSLMHADDMKSVVQKAVPLYKAIINGILNKKEVFPLKVEVRLLQPDGKWIWAEIYFHLRYSNEELATPDTYFLLTRNITNYKAGEVFLWEELKKRSVSEDQMEGLKKKYLQIRQEVHSAQKGAFPFEPPSNSFQALTEREKEILRLIAKGRSSMEISKLLQISFHTVETHRKGILEKLNVKNTAELIQTAGKSTWLGN